MTNGEGHYSMVQECTDHYEAARSMSGDLEIRILVPRRFADLWLVKLNGLRTNDAEISEYEPASQGDRESES